MKKILTLLLAFILVVGCVSPTFAAESDYKFIIEVDDSTIKVGDTVKVSFKIESNTGDDFKIYTMQDYIGFDTEFFEFVENSLNVTNGFAATYQGDCVFVNRYSGSTDFANGGTVLSFELKALKSGETEFTHSVVEMIDDDMNFYSVEKVGADVTVSPSGSTEAFDYKFIIEVDDSTIKVGDTVKVSFKIESNDGDDFKIYAMQDYIGFDTDFFDYVENSLNVTEGFTATYQGDCVYVNRYSGSKDFANGDTVLSFELKARKSGETEFTHSIVEMIDGDLNFYSVEKVGADVTVSSSGSTETRYNISLDYNDRYGDVDVSRSSAIPGTKITVTPSPKTGYEVDSVVVTRDSNGRTVRVTENLIRGTYTFTMPADDVTIEVIFVSSVGTGNRIRVDDSYENGTVAVSHRRAEKGETVDIFPDPDDGYEVDTIEVYWTDSHAGVRVTANDDGSYSFKMPDGAVTIKVMFKKSADTTEPDEDTTTTDPGTTPGGEVVHICPSEPYTDVDQTLWYHEAIDYVISYGLMNGYDADTFGPNDTTTRAMIATIIWRLEGSPKSTADIPFSDISEGQWYSEAVRWAAENDIVKGLGDGTFAPEMAITREQFAAMIYRYEQYKGGGFKGLWMYQLKFPDLDTLSSWAVEAVSWCNMNGIIKGNGAGYLNPLGEATRAEAAQILMNYKTLAK